MNYAVRAAVRLLEVRILKEAEIDQLGPATRHDHAGRLQVEVKQPSCADSPGPT